MQNTHQEIPKLYTVKEAIRLMGLSKSTFYNLATAGSIKLIKIGDKTLVSHSNIVDVMTNGAPVKYTYREGAPKRQRRGIKIG